MPKSEKRAAKPDSKPTPTKTPVKKEPVSKSPLSEEIEKAKAKEKEKALRPHSFKDSSGTRRQLTGLQYKFCLEYLSNHGNGSEAIIEAGYDVFYKDNKGRPTLNINYALARVMASENLTKPNVCAFITSKLKEYGYDDDNVELQHLFLINQFDNLPTKQRAISDYYKLKNRYPAAKVEHSGHIDVVEVERYAEEGDGKTTAQ